MRNNRILLFLIFFLSLILRLYFLSKGPLYTDVIELAMMARSTLESLQLHYQHAAGYPFNVILASLFEATLSPLGISDIKIVNIMSAIFSAKCGHHALTCEIFVHQK